MRVRLAVTILLVALTSGACNRGDDPTVEIEPGTTSSSTTPGTSPAAPATTAAAAPRPTPAAAATPDAAAKGLFDAWQKGDRGEASRFGRPHAVKELFSHPDTGDDDYQQQGCNPQGGQFQCSWTYPGGALHMTVEDVPGGGYIVELVSYTAD